MTENFREETKKEIFWPAIKGMRNIFAHNYGAVDIERLWETVISDIPQLRGFCEQTIQMYHFLEQEENEAADSEGAMDG